MKKPWEKGYIPKPGSKPKFTGPATPKGWVQVDQEGCIEFRRYGLSLWQNDVIVGVVGKPWKLWINHSPGTPRQPDMQMTSLTALVAWYEVELTNRADEPNMYKLPASHTITGRQAGKSATMMMRYGMSPGRFQQTFGRIDRIAGAEITGVARDDMCDAATYLLPDFTAIEERAAAWMEQANQLQSMGTQQPSKAGTGSPASSSTSEVPSGETGSSGLPTSAETPGTEGG